MLKKIAHIVIFFALSLWASNLFAKVYNLKTLLELSNNHPEVAIEAFEVEKASKLFDRIDGETGPKISILSGLAPNKSTSGNALTSQTSSSVDTISYLAQIELRWPLFMFNRTNDLKNAANGNQKIKELDVLKKKNLLKKQIKEYYYGLQYAYSLDRFAASTLKDLDEAIESFKESKKNNRQEDLTKLTIFRSLAQTKKYEIEKGLAQGLLGLKYITQEDAPSIEQDWIEFNPIKIPSKDEILSSVNKSNLDFQKAAIGLDAKKAYLQSEKKAFLPTFGIFSKYDWMDTAKSTTQQSSFAYDTHNKSDFSIGIGMVWELDFGIKSSNISIAQIDYNQIARQKEFAEKNLPLKIEKIYLELIEAEKKSYELEKAYKSSKKLLANIATGAAFGLTPAKEIIEVYSLKAQVYKDYVESIYNYELKLSELSFETGMDFNSPTN